MEIPYQTLTKETLSALLEDFVTREGAVHGHVDVAVESMMTSLRRQLEAGKAKILYDEADESWTIVASPGGQKVKD